MGGAPGGAGAEELRRLHEAGVPVTALSRLYRREPATIARLVAEAGGAVRPGKNRPRPAPAWLPDAVARYGAGEGLATLARAHGVGRLALARWLEEAGVPLRRHGARPAPRPAAPVPADELAARYAAGESELALAPAFGVSVAAARAFLEAVGVELRPAAWRPRVALPDAELIARYLAGETVRALAAEHGRSDAAVRARLVAAGVPIRGRGEANRLRFGRAGRRWAP